MKQLILVLGVVGVSTSVLFVRWSTAPTLILILYRMIFTLLMLSPSVFLHHRKELFSLSRRELLLCIASGFALGLHFWTNFSAVRITSIASAAVLTHTEVLFVALATVVLLRKRLSGIAWFSVALAFVGSALIAMADTAAGSGALLGDALALICAVFLAGYTMLGAVCRRTVSTTVYTYLVYAATLVTVLFISLAGGVPVTGYGMNDYGAALGMAVCCTLLGHSVFSWGLKYFSPAFVSTIKLLDSLFSAIWGLVLFAEMPGLQVIFGGLIIVAAVIIYCRAPQEV